MRLILASIAAALFALSYPVLGADQHNPKATKTADKEQAGGKLGVPATTTQAVVRSDEAKSRDDKQRDCALTRSWVSCMVTKTITDTELFLIFGAGLFAAIAAFFTGRVYYAEVMREKRELRAYMAVDDVYFPWKPNEIDPTNRTAIIRGSHPKVRVINLGATPALDVRIRIASAHTQRHEPFLRSYRDPNFNAPRHNIGPSQKFGTRIPWTFDPYATEERDTLVHYYFGVIVYQDIYRRWYLKRFSYFYDPDPTTRNRFIPDTEHNDEQEYENERAALDSLRYT